MSDWETIGNIHDDGDWITQTPQTGSITVPLPPAREVGEDRAHYERRMRFRRGLGDPAEGRLEDRTDPKIAKEVDRLTKRQERGTRERTRGERFVDQARDAAIRSPIIGLEGVYRLGLKAKGWSDDEINRAERQIVDYYEYRNRSDPDDDWVDTGVDLLGGMAGSIDLSMVVAPGRGLATKALSQAGINAGVDAGMQQVSKARGVQDEYSWQQTGINALAGGLFEGVSHGIGRAVSNRRIRRGERMPGWKEVNDVILSLEGGGTVDAPKVSPKGAMGPQQVMPGTARDPGFGIRPWDGKSQEDLARVGRQYSAALMAKYRGDTEKVLAAYNAGPGRVDGLIRKYGDDWRAYLPDEAKAYVENGLEKLGLSGGREGVPPMDPAMMARAMNDPEAGVRIDEETLDAEGIDAPGLREDAPSISRDEYEARAKAIRDKMDAGTSWRDISDEDKAFYTEYHRNDIQQSGIVTPEDAPPVSNLDAARADKERADEIAAYSDMLSEMRQRLDQIEIGVERGLDGTAFLPGIKERHDAVREILDDPELPPELRPQVEDFLQRSRALSLKMGGPQLGLKTSVRLSDGSPPPRPSPWQTNDNWRPEAEDGGIISPPRSPEGSSGGGPRDPDGPRGPGGDGPSGEGPRGPDGEEPMASPWAESVNLNRLDISDRAKALIRQIAEGVDSRGIETHGETSAKAQALIDEHGIEGVLSMDAPDIESLPALSVATRALLEASSENVVKLADEIIDPTRATPMASHKFEHAMLLAAAAFEKANRNANIAGRLLQAFRIMSRQGDVSAFATIRREMGADASVYDIAKKIAENRAHAAQIAADGLQPGALDKFSSLWYNWKLSGLTSQTANLIGTMAHLGLDMASRMVGVGVGVARMNPDRAHMDEIWARVIGLYSGLKQAFASVEVDGKTTRPIYEAWKIGMPLDFVNKTRSGRAFHGKYSQYLETATRGMAVVDEIFRNIAVVSDMNGQAYRIARAEGLEGDAFKNRVLQLIENPTREMEEAALEYGKRMRFADDASAITTRLEQARRIGKDDRLGDKAMAVFARMIVPFMHTLDRLTAASVSHSPIGFLNSRNQKDLVQGGAEVDIANGRMIVGTALVAYAAMKAFAGDPTGAEGEDFREIEAKRAEGKGPYNIRIGDRWASMKQLQPLSTLLGATASVVETYKKTEDSDSAFTQFFDIARKMGDAALSGAWTESLHNFFGGSKSSPESRWANWAAGAFDPVPTIARQAWQTFGDPQERDTTSDGSFAGRVLDRWKAGTPLSTTLPQKHDIYGRPLNRGDAIGPDIASPLKAQKVDDNVVVREISAINDELRKTVIGRVKREKGMSSAEFQALQKATGERFMSKMNDIVFQPEWQNLDAAAKAKIAKKVWSEASKFARGKTRNEDDWVPADDWQTVDSPESDWVTVNE